MEKTEVKKPVKVWPRDFVSFKEVSATQESLAEVNAEPDLPEENLVDVKDEEIENDIQKEQIEENNAEKEQLEANSEKEEMNYGKRRETIIRVNPIHVEARVIDIKK